MRELFVYYRADAATAGSIRREVLAMHDRLREAHAGLVTRLLVRPADGSAQQTWMETYALPGVAGGVGADVEVDIQAEAASWAHLIAGSRHVEAFVAS